MSITFGFEVDELDGSPSEKINRDSGFSATRKFRVPWGNRIEFAAAMSTAHYPNYPAVRVDDIAIDPHNDKCDAVVTDFEAHLNSYDHALVVINYSSIKSATRQEQPDGTYLTYRQSQSAEFLTIPSRALVWDDNDEPVSPDARAAVLIPRTEHVITWSDVPRPDWQRFSDVRGHVNESGISIPVIGLFAAPETLLFKGVETNAKVSTSGDVQYDVTVALSEKTIKAYSDTVYGWNHAFRDNPSGWHKPVNSNGDPSYPRGELGNLFQQA